MLKSEPTQTERKRENAGERRRNEGGVLRGGEVSGETSDGLVSSVGEEISTGMFSELINTGSSKQWWRKRKSFNKVELRPQQQLC